MWLHNVNVTFFHIFTPERVQRFRVQSSKFRVWKLDLMGKSLADNTIKNITNNYEQE